MRTKNIFNIEITAGGGTETLDITDVSNSTGEINVGFTYMATSSAVSIHMTFVNDPPNPANNTGDNEFNYYTITTIATTARSQIFDYGRNAPF